MQVDNIGHGKKGLREVTFPSIVKKAEASQATMAEKVNAALEALFKESGELLKMYGGFLFHEQKNNDFCSTPKVGTCH